MIDFIQRYFIEPIFYGTGYNVYNTIVYAILFLISLYIIYRLLEYLKIDINKDFLIYVTPYIIFGGILRALKDAGILKSVLFVTPLIYIVVFSITFSILLISLHTKNKLFNWSVIGIALCLISLIFVHINQIEAFLSFAFFIPIALFVIAFYTIYPKFSITNLYITIAHAFDVATTFVALTFFPYIEQHVVPNILISMFGAYAMLIKIPIVILALYVIDKETNGNENGILKLGILVLGLAPATRNFLRMLMNV